MIRASLDDSFFQYKAVTISIAVGTFLSLFVFVLFLGQGLESHKQEFRSIAQSELSFIQKELEDLESSLNDAYFYMKTQADMKFSDLEILFRNEMRNRLFGLIFYLPIQESKAALGSSYHLILGDSNLISTEGVPDVSDFIDYEPQIIHLNEKHPLYRSGSILLAMPFPAKGSLFINIDLEKIIDQVDGRQVFKGTSHAFIFRNSKLLFSSQGARDPLYYYPLEDLKPEQLKEFSSYYEDSFLVFLNQKWDAILIPSQSYLASSLGIYPWLFLFACLFITALVSFAFYHLLLNQARIERTVELRTKELKEKSEELSRLNNELKSFAYIVSHDLQEPIRTISTFLDIFIAEQSAGLSAEAQHLLGRIRSAAQRMHRLLKDILQYSRLSVQSQNFQNVDMNILIQEVWDNLNAKVDENHAVLRIIGDLPSLYADPPQLQQLFQNLFSNSIKFRRPDEAPAITVSSRLLPEGTNWEFRVEDNGTGFDPKYSEMIFMPFHRLHREEEIEGSGIGLAICRKIVERHGGSISAEAQVGKGSTFIIRLPVSASQASGRRLKQRYA